MTNGTGGPSAQGRRGLSGKFYSVCSRFSRRAAQKHATNLGVETAGSYGELTGQQKKGVSRLLKKSEKDSSFQEKLTPHTQELVKYARVEEAIQGKQSKSPSLESLETQNLLLDQIVGGDRNPYDYVKYLNPDIIDSYCHQKHDLNDDQLRKLEETKHHLICQKIDDTSGNGTLHSYKVQQDILKYLLSININGNTFHKVPARELTLDTIKCVDYKNFSKNELINFKEVLLIRSSELARHMPSVTAHAEESIKSLGRYNFKNVIDDVQKLIASKK